MSRQDWRCIDAARATRIAELEAELAQEKKWRIDCGKELNDERAENNRLKQALEKDRNLIEFTRRLGDRGFLIRKMDKIRTLAKEAGE